MKCTLQQWQTIYKTPHKSGRATRLGSTWSPQVGTPQRYTNKFATFVENSPLSSMANSQLWAGLCELSVGVGLLPQVFWSQGPPYRIRF